ncbi:hypothetical protein C8Q79DRAFT_1069591 [Trametes meyenii]|nr:hypothetical protein C8Q79DRAFT_1069591 [Trametes meyenii]
MKLVVRVQYIGDRARILLRDDQAAEYTKGLIDDLTFFGFPIPHEQKPIEKSGFMLCVYYVDRDSDMHRIIQNAFSKAKAEAATLVDRSIRYISLNEDGVMHTTNLSQKQYKPKTYSSKPDYQTPQQYQNPGIYKPAPQPYGKAPKYPTTISQARHAVSPLTPRMVGDLPGPSGHGADYRDHDMHLTVPSPPAGRSDGATAGIDVTQQTLLQLSQSSAFQSLLQKAVPSPSVPHIPVKAEPASPPDLSMLLRQPISAPLPQPQIPNLQALLEKAGVKSASAHALLQDTSPSSQYHPSTSLSGLGAPLHTTSSSVAVPASPLTTSHHTHALGAQPATSTSAASTSAGAGTNPSRSPVAPRVPTLRELWDIRREITALQARGRNVAADLRAAGQQIPLGPEDATPPTMTGTNTNNGADLLKMRELEAEIHGLRKQLAREAESRKLAEATLRAERALRSEVEDVKRECREPFVVPALYDAFMKIGQLSGDALSGAPPPGSVPMEF